MSIDEEIDSGGMIKCRASTQQGPLHEEAEMSSNIWQSREISKHPQAFHDA